MISIKIVKYYKFEKFFSGKFTISAGNTVMPVYTAELYPTAIRNAGVGACNVAAGLALIIVPYMSLLVCYSHIGSKCVHHKINNLLLALHFLFPQNKIQSYFLMLLMSTFSVLGSMVVIFLPESMPHEAMKRNSNASKHIADDQQEER